MKIAFNILLIFGVGSLIGCGRPENSDSVLPAKPIAQPPKPEFPDVAQNPPPPPAKAPPPQMNKLPTAEKPRYIQSGNLQGADQRKLDILFVVDTSDSMDSDQDNLSNNIDKFVDVFVRNKRIDFQVGVVTTWDSITFGNSRRRYANGELVRVGNRDDKRFVGNKDVIYNDPKVPAARNQARLNRDLKRHIKVGTARLNQANPAVSGPNHEEIFSPILEALSPEMLKGPNAGFLRENSYLAIVIITDTEDLTPLDSAVAQLLAGVESQRRTLDREARGTKGVYAVFQEALLSQGRKAQGDPESRPDDLFLSAADVSRELAKRFPDRAITILGALGRLDEMRNNEPAFSQRFACQSTRRLICPYSVDPMLWSPGYGPKEIEALVQQMGGESFDLKAKDFGPRMANLGKKILSRMWNLTIPLDTSVDPDEPIRLKIQGREIPRRDRAGNVNWHLSEDGLSIQLSKTINDKILDDGFKLADLDEFNFELSYTTLAVRPPAAENAPSAGAPSPATP
jgi:hypothetical protein